MKKYKKTLLLLIIMFIVSLSFLLGIDWYVRKTAEKRFISVNEASDLLDVDAILILGCQVKNNDTPSSMLKERLLKGIELYDEKAALKIIMSGDHGQDNYDEVNVMKDFAIQAGIPSADIFMDHAGFSTYESIYRAKEIFQAKKIIIVTQEYHLYRALYIADRLGLDAYGVLADTKQYSGQVYRNVREILARVKDFCYTIFQPKPTYLGETIPVSGNGDLTNDK